MVNMELCASCDAEDRLEKMPAIFFPIPKQYGGTATYAFCEKCRNEALNLLVNPAEHDITYECFRELWDSLNPSQKLLLIRFQDLETYDRRRKEKRKENGIPLDA